jgi:DnaJ-class molecular chaperone
MSRLIDCDSEEETKFQECETCRGLGGFDASRNCEEYDDWQTCPDCEGRGEVEYGYEKPEIFDPKRDAWTPND